MRLTLVIAVLLLSISFAQSPGEGQPGLLQRWTSNEAQAVMDITAPWEEFGPGYECPSEVQEELSSYDVEGWDCLEFRAPLLRLTDYVEGSLNVIPDYSVRWGNNWEPWYDPYIRSAVFFINGLPMGLIGFGSDDGWTRLVIIHYKW